MSARTPPPPKPRSSRGLDVALWITALVWASAAAFVAEHAGHGIALRFGLSTVEGLLQRVFTLFLLVLGFRILDWLAARGRFAGEVLPLPRRTGWPGEWGVGAAVGWGLALAAVLPLVLSGNLHAQLNLEPASLLAAAVALLTLLVGMLAQEVLFRGYPFRRLMAAVGQTWATLIMSVLFALTLTAAGGTRWWMAHSLVSLLSCTLLGLLLATACLRTNALWVPWGLAFAYRAVMTVLLGLPIAGDLELASLTGTSTSGPRWLSGGHWGLDAAWLTPLLILIAISVLYTATREYAWNYTHPLILPAGYAVDVAPPAAHVAMERAAAPAPPPLVQILPATPRGGSIPPVPSDQT